MKGLIITLFGFPFASLHPSLCRNELHLLHTIFRNFYFQTVQLPLQSIVNWSSPTAATKNKYGFLGRDKPTERFPFIPF